jgi:hypothetical protein
VATILSGAFVVAQASSHTVQSSQEHSYALQQIQAQTELIRALAHDPNSNANFSAKTKTVGSQFCTFANPSGNVVVNDGNSAACKNIAGLYTITDTVTKLADPAKVGDLTTFKVEINWAKLGGGVNHESLVYGVDIR